MAQDNTARPSTTNVTRRRLLQVGAAGAFSAAGAGAALFGMPVVTLAKPLSATDQNILTFVMGLFAARGQAVLENEPSIIRPMYDPAQTAMVAFEVERVSRLHHAAHDFWHGEHKRVYSNLSQFVVTPAGARRYKITFREMLCFDWHYDPIPLPASVEAERKRRHPDPSAWASPSLANPDGTFPQNWVIDHELTVEMLGSRFIVLAHAYIEAFHASPDAGGGIRTFPGGPVPALAPGASSNAQSLAHGPQTSPQGSPSQIYYPSNAVAYANQYGSSRNCGTYVDWDYPNGGGDCANFVSQCLWAGGLGVVADGTWNRGSWTSMRCPAGSGSYQGGYSGSTSSPYAWTDNAQLRAWVINSGRGTDSGGNVPQFLAIGDLINYDFHGYGNMDHITIVVQAMTSYQPAYVQSHNANGRWLWNMGGAYHYWGTELYWY